jgi:hypothetical protein
MFYIEWLKMDEVRGVWLHRNANIFAGRLYAKRQIKQAENGG